MESFIYLCWGFRHQGCDIGPVQAAAVRRIFKVHLQCQDLTESDMKLGSKRDPFLLGSLHNGRMIAGSAVSSSSES